MQIGLEYTAILNVEQRHLAVNVGSGDLEVLATPAMIALMENASMMAVKDVLEEEQTTVGGYISSSHLKPTSLGATIKATAKLVAVEGRKLTFKITAEDDGGTIGEGEHIRFVVDTRKFMSKLQG